VRSCITSMPRPGTVSTSAQFWITRLAIEDRLIELKTVEVEGHRAHAKGVNRCTHPIKTGGLPGGEQ